jgi:hypothetical protein
MQDLSNAALQQMQKPHVQSQSCERAQSRKQALKSLGNGFGHGAELTIPAHT